MEITCPACRKLNRIPDDGSDSTCARCGCELDQLAAIAHAAQAQLQDAGDALRAGDVRAALDHANRSWRLHRSPLAAAAASLAAACSGDATALDCWRRRWTDTTNRS